jgi:hypothetical protein
LGSCTSPPPPRLAGPGGGPRLTIYHGVSQAVLDSFFAFAPGFGSGVYVGGN